MHRITVPQGSSPEECLVLARFATRARRAGRRQLEKLSHGAFVAL